MVWTEGLQLLGGPFYTTGVGNKRRFAEQINTQLMAERGNKVISGCDPTVGAATDLSGAGNHLNVSAGDILVAGTVLAFGGGDVDLSGAQGGLALGQSRYVLITIYNSVGVATLRATNGTVATDGQQEPPESPQDEVDVCIIYLTYADTTMSSNQIGDWRIPVPDGLYVAGDGIFANDTSILEIRNTNAINSGYAAIDVTEQGSFGDAAGFGFRTMYDALSNEFRIQSGNGASVNTRMTIERDTGNVGIGITPTNILTTQANDSVKLERNGLASSIVYSVLDVLATKTTSSGTNFGAAITFYIQDDDDVENDIGNISFAKDGADNGGKFALQVRNVGSITDRITIARTGNIELLGGNVGIGVTPESALSFKAQENDNASIRWLNGHSVTTDAAISTFDDAAGTQITIGSNFFVNGSGSNTRFNTGEESCGISLTRAGNISFLTGSTGATAAERMRIDIDGNVGIGVTPTSPLHTESSNTGIFQSIIYNTHTSGHGLHIRADGTTSTQQALQIRTGSGVNTFVVDCAGSVGMGLTPHTDYNASWKALNINLAVLQAHPSADSFFIQNNSRYTSAADFKYRVADTAGKIQMSSTGIQLSVAPTGTINGVITWIDALNIDITGNVGIGVAPTELFHVFGGASEPVQLFDSTLSAAGDIASIKFQAHNSISANTVYGRIYGQIITNTDGAEDGAIVLATTVAGTEETGFLGLLGNEALSKQFRPIVNSISEATGFELGTSSFAWRNVYTWDGTIATSSQRYKHNINTINNSLDILNKLRGVSFDWNESKLSSYGLIAEEVAHILPDIVSYNDEGLANGMKYTKLIPFLVEGIKELYAIVERNGLL